MSTSGNFYHSAIVSNNLEALKNLILVGLDFNEVCNGVSPLYLACFLGHKEQVTILLDNHATINWSNKSGNTPLFVAAQNGHLEIVKILIANGADINQKNMHNCTPLIISSFCVTQQNVHSDISLTWQHQNGEISCPIDFSIDKNSSFISPIMFLSRTQTIEESIRYSIVKCLIENGANINHQMESEINALFVAAQNGRFTIVSLLLDFNAQVDLPNCEGITPLMIACQEGFVDIVQLLCENKSNVNYLSLYKYTPFWFCAFSGNVKIAEILFKYGGLSSLNIVNNKNESPLYIATKNNHTHFIEFILQYNPSIDISGPFDMTPLCVACLKGNIHIVKILLQKGSSLHFFTQNKFTPLMLAIYQKNYEIVQFLLLNGANPNLSNPIISKSCLDLANNPSFDPYMNKILLEYGAKLCFHSSLTQIIGEVNQTKIIIKNIFQLLWNILPKWPEDLLVLLIQFLFGFYPK